MKKIVINLALFQIGWMVCVLGGNLYALAFTTLALIIHQWQVVSSKREWRLIAIVVLIGCLWDFTMASTGVIRFDESGPLGIPLWLICLWLLFATTFMHGLFWLNRHIWLAAIFAAVAGPASYWMGANLSGVQLGVPLFGSLLVMAAGWAVLFPFGIYYAGKLKT